jgi:hypothetical protein
MASGTITQLGGAVRTMWPPENAARVCRARRAARRHSVALNVPGRSLRRILQYELHFHPYKLHTGQELSDCDCVSRGASCEQFVTLVNKHTNCSSFHNVAHFWTAYYIMFLNDSNAFIFQLTLF